MAIDRKDIRAYGIASPPTSDATSPIGGAIATNKLVEWVGPSGTLEGVSSDAGDVGTFVLAAFGLDIGSNEFIDSIATGGTTPQPFAQSFAQVLRGNINNTAAVGDVAIMAQTKTRSNTAAAGGADLIQLDAGASAVNNFYNGQIVRLTGGTGQFQIRQIIAYVGATKIATVDRAWGTNPDNTSTFDIAKGCYFPGPAAPFQITQVWRMFYHARGAPAAGPTKVLYDKFFFRNNHATDSAAAAQVLMTDPTGGFLSFGLAAAINDSLITTTRLVAPAGITFGTSPISVPGGTLGPGDRIGVWVRLTRPALAAVIPDMSALFQFGWT